MTGCEHCLLLEKRELLLFEDDKVAAFLAPRPAATGHVIVVPRQHTAILEQEPDYVVGALFVAANRVSTALFEVMRVHGTNIMLENGTAAGQGTPHVAVNIIPRTENDGLGFVWEPKKFSDEQVGMAELQLKQHTEKLGRFEEEKRGPVKLEQKGERITKEDYFTRQLRRMP